ncbi:MAG: glycogen/starch/alpha-glucan phosphorylase [Clostridia bacterium]|nr:glycogen/starch/alpha-glucan phosphorylase [Clostridia bacterium]MEE1185596.1 glycogen/starch/alpha-glucan phosphorylase [Acutalibacteraceae bacterium]
MGKYTAAQLSALIERKLLHNLGVAPDQASDELFYKACVLALLEIMSERRANFKKSVDEQEAKQIYYLSMEFLMGRSLKNNLFNLELTETMAKALSKFKVKLDKLYDFESDAGLGNGGLGRLAACFLDGLSTGSYPAMGYCIRYELGIFRQKLVDGWQTEMPDFWLPGGGVWLEARPSSAVDVNFDGRIEEWWDGSYHHVEHKDYNSVHAVPYDLMVAGKDGKTVNVLRLWSAECQDFDMSAFNQGDYVRALERRAMAESISKVLYPEDNHMEGKSLRLRQQYFLVSASIQDILNRHLRKYNTLENLPEKVAIHINDTHPTLSIPELMRFLLDECGYSWEKAWDIVKGTLAYTNHTIMKEALECWPVDLFKARLPRIYQIVKEIDRRFRDEVIYKTGDFALAERTAVISDGVVKMANLCVAACHTVNGVSKLHSKILVDELFKDYYSMTPEKFTNVTNGIAHRRWLCQANPELTKYLTELIGDGFIKDASELDKLSAYADDKTVLNQLEKIKHSNKERFAQYVKAKYDVALDTNSIFDMQVKRLHEYKRQHLNALHIISDYLYLKNNPNAEFTPKTYIFGAKAAPGYLFAKEIIHMIYKLSEVIAKDKAISDKIKVLFLEDYKVTLAELMIPAADISEQISLASTEASGTGNMKLMMNGAVTLGTEDGANVEIHKAVGDDNIFIFGMHTPEVLALQKSGYSPSPYYNNNPDLKKALDFVGKGINGKSFDNIYNTLKNVDHYMALADFADYCKAQTDASIAYNDRDRWNRMSLMNIAKSGIFAADRSIADYANNIWHIEPIK